MRYAVSLTSIPPRLHRLAPVLASLAGQDPAPECILLSLPRRYRRFPDAVDQTLAFPGVDVLWSAQDHGPATKALVAARHLMHRTLKLIYCDDDWLYSPGWAAALLDGSERCATTGQAWDLARIGRTGAGCDIAQGFSGVCITPSWLAGAHAMPPEPARDADDVWLSGVLAFNGIEVRAVSSARAAMRPAYEDTHGLQDANVAGQTRDIANRAAAQAIHDRFGIWPVANQEPPGPHEDICRNSVPPGPARR